MSYREDQRLRSVATEAGRADLAEALDRADAELDEAHERTRAAHRRWQELDLAQTRKAEEGKEIRRQIRDLTAAISKLENMPDLSTCGELADYLATQPRDRRP